MSSILLSLFLLHINNFSRLLLFLYHKEFSFLPLLITKGSVIQFQILPGTDTAHELFNKQE